MRSTAWIVSPSTAFLGAFAFGTTAIEKPSFAASRRRSWPRGFIAFGEVGLAGEVRPAPRGQERLREAAKLGFSVAIVPKANAPRGKPIEGLTIHAVERIEQAIELARSL